MGNTEIVEVKYFREAYNTLTREFAEKYYEGYVENELGQWERYLLPIWISDDYWGIDDVYMALALNVPEKIVHNYYSYTYDHAMENKKPKLNFYHYYLKNK